MLRLGQTPSDERIDEAIDRYIEFINLEYDVSKKAHLSNEKYFLKVFKALWPTRNPVTIKKMLKII